MKIGDFSVIREQLRPLLRTYLEQHGVNTKGKFRCINPGHEDKTPSCNVFRDVSFRCFGCGIYGDVFTAATLLEGKPASGKGFITDNAMYLAQRFGIEFKMPELTEDEIYELDTYRAYRDASRILTNSDRSERVKSKLTQYGWTEDLQWGFGIGGVASFDEYIHRMTKQYGYSRSFLKEIDLDRKDIFNPDCLIFTIKDENGNPVGFAARNLRYEEEMESYQRERTRLIEEKGEDSEEVARLRLPKKYVNSAADRMDGETAVRNRIYQKSKRLFGLHSARRFVPPLYVFEGYSDCVTAVKTGIKNSCAIGSTSFSRDQLEMVLGLDIRHIIFVLDADKAGEEGTGRFVKLLEDTLGGHVGLRVEIVTMPTGTDDPDAFIRKNGVDAFRKLDRMDVFSWNLRKAVRDGEDPELVARRSIQLIVNEGSSLVRYRKARQLADCVGVPLDVIWRDVTREVDSDHAQIEEQKTIVARKAADQLRNNPNSAEMILQSTQLQIDNLNRQKQGFDVDTLLRHNDALFHRFEGSNSEIDLKTGWPLFDKWVGGLPSEDVFVSIPGKTNQGKSSLLCNLAWRLLDNNPNLMILYHTIDDSMGKFLPRLLGSRFNVTSRWFERAGFYLPAKPEFEDVYRKAQQWYIEQIESERLVAVDIGTLPAIPSALETWVKALRQKHPDRKFLVIGDNFHLYEAGYGDNEAKMLRDFSKRVKTISNRYHCAMVMTMELPKDALYPGKRPRVQNIKGTSGISYDSNMNIGVYNDLKDFGDSSKLVWLDQSDQRPSIGPNGELMYAATRKPILELVFDKSKVGFGYDGVIYCRFWPETGRMEECTEAEQGKFRALAGDTQLGVLQMPMAAIPGKF